jgi:hypothetical protein
MSNEKSELGLAKRDRVDIEWNSNTVSELDIYNLYFL